MKPRPTSLLKNHHTTTWRCTPDSVQNAGAQPTVYTVQACSCLLVGCLQLLDELGQGAQGTLTGGGGLDSEACGGTTKVGDQCCLSGLIKPNCTGPRHLHLHDAAEHHCCMHQLYSPRKATIARRPCLISAVFSLKTFSSSPEARPRGSKKPPTAKGKPARKPYSQNMARPSHPIPQCRQQLAQAMHGPCSMTLHWSLLHWCTWP